jgi:hypothetical protein
LLIIGIDPRVWRALNQGIKDCAFHLVFFAIVGFVGGYLLTRLFLAGAFWRADSTQSVTVTEEKKGVPPPSSKN